MAEVAAHRTLTAHLPEHPVHHLGLQARVGGQEAVELLGEVPHDGARLEQVDGLAVGTLLVGGSGDLGVGIHSHKSRGELISSADVND